MRPIDKVETERLVLRLPVRDDAKRIYEAFGTDPEVTRYLGWRPHTSPEQAEEAMSRRLAALAEGRELSWVLTLRETGELIGNLSLWPGGHQVELGYVLGRAHWNRGYMTEAARALIDWALAQDGVYRVWASADVDNTASARVLEKCGMRHEGVLRRFGVHPNVSAEPRDCVLYARVRP